MVYISHYFSYSCKYIYNGNEKAENVISDLVRIYIGASFIIIGIIYKLGKNK